MNINYKTYITQIKNNVMHNKKQHKNENTKNKIVNKNKKLIHHTI